MNFNNELLKDYLIQSLDNGISAEKILKSSKSKSKSKYSKEEFTEEKKYIKNLASRSQEPEIRNLMRPISGKYAPIYYNEDYMITLEPKLNWGGYILALITWDFLIIDIDAISDINIIKKRIQDTYPNDLFYICKTRNGFHLYLMNYYGQYL